LAERIGLSSRWVYQHKAIDLTGLATRATEFLAADILYALYPKQPPQMLSSMEVLTRVGLVKSLLHSSMFLLYVCPLFHFFVLYIFLTYFYYVFITMNFQAFMISD
jgi:hypothetical protein